MAALVEGLGLADKLRGARRIVLKPNLCAGTSRREDSAVVVRRQLVATTIQAVRRLNTEGIIYVAESDSSGGGYAYQKFEHQGYDELVAHWKGVELLDLTRDRLTKIEVGGLHFSTLTLSRTLAGCDFFISVGKMKTHNITQVTGVLKNQLGCLPDPDKKPYHPYLDKAICDINRVLRPDLCVVDGDPAMEGDGPVYGWPKPLNLVIVGNDPVAVDAVMAHLMGFRPSAIGYLRLAAQQGLGEVELGRIEVASRWERPDGAPFRFIGPGRRAMVACGLGAQALGQSLAKAGHRAHTLKSPWGVIRLVGLWLLYATARPIYRALGGRVIRKKLRALLSRSRGGL